MIAFLLTLAISPAHAAPFTFEDLQRLIRVGNLRSVEQVLPLLPAEFRSSYTLMRESRSLQDASARNPRALLFGRDASLVCSFNGDAAQYANDSLECVQFLAAARTFEFHQIEFPAADNDLKEVQIPPANHVYDSDVSCKDCHGDDPRPIWDNYAFWPGAYGETDDRVAGEDPDYRGFREGRDANPRYRWLIQNDYASAPYRTDFGEVDITHRPNFRLSELFGRMNALRAARILGERLPAWEVAAYVVSALHCELDKNQLESLTKSGLNPQAMLPMAKIFGDVGLRSFEWSTQDSADKQNYADRPWEHQSGFSMFSESVAMAVVQDAAHAGNATYAGAIQAILAYYAKTYYDEERKFNETLNEIVPSPDFFGPGYADNLGRLCPEATKQFVAAFGKSAPPKTP